MPQKTSLFLVLYQVLFPCNRSAHCACNFWAILPQFTENYSYTCTPLRVNMYIVHNEFLSGRPMIFHINSARAAIVVSLILIANSSGRVGKMDMPLKFEEKAIL